MATKTKAVATVSRDKFSAMMDAISRAYATGEVDISPARLAKTVDIPVAEVRQMMSDPNFRRRLELKKMSAKYSTLPQEFCYATCYKEASRMFAEELLDYFTQSRMGLLDPKDRLKGKELIAYADKMKDLYEESEAKLNDKPTRNLTINMILAQHLSTIENPGDQADVVAAIGGMIQAQLEAAAEVEAPERIQPEDIIDAEIEEIPNAD